MGQGYSTEYFYPTNKSVILLNDSINLIIINSTDDLELHHYHQISYRLAGRGYIVVIIKDENKSKKQIKDISEIFNKNYIHITGEITNYLMREYDINRIMTINNVILLSHELTASESVIIANNNNNYKYKISHLILFNPIINKTNPNLYVNYNQLNKMIIVSDDYDHKKSLKNLNSILISQTDKVIKIKGAKSDVFYNKYVSNEKEIEFKSKDWNMIADFIHQFIIGSL